MTVGNYNRTYIPPVGLQPQFVLAGARMESAVTVGGLFAQFVLGVGPAVRVFGSKSPITQELMKSPLLESVRRKYLNQMGRKLDNGGVIEERTYHVDFGGKGLLISGHNFAAQFVGSFDVTFMPLNGGRDLYVSVTNTTSFWSLTYHKLPSWSREAFPFLGTTTQFYIWTEPFTQ